MSNRFVAPSWTITIPVKLGRRIVDSIISRGARTPGGAFRRAFCENRQAITTSSTVHVFKEVRT